MLGVFLDCVRRLVPDKTFVFGAAFNFAFDLFRLLLAELVAIHEYTPQRSFFLDA